MSDLSGTIVRGYELRTQSGAGGFGAIYRAYQPVIGREVAIKVILPELASQPDFIRRFEAEAQLVARLEHPNIIPLYDYWRDPTGAYLVMRWLPGGSLRDLLQRREPLTLVDIAAILDQIAAALAVAHRHGVIHRDIKPDNILLDEDRNVYLADFGIAKDTARGESDGTPHGAVIGSPAYLAPEQLTGEPVSPQTDIYSLGVVLYELLTGQRPFPGDLTSTALIFKLLHEPVPSLLTAAPHLPAALDDVIARATAKDPQARFSDARMLAGEFKRAAFKNGWAGAESDPVVLLPLDGESGESPLPDGQHSTLLLLDIRAIEPENPYKGLRPFEEADAADFFGREALTNQLIARLGETGAYSRFLAVVGPSGSGKSSVVMAGLIPALKRGALPGSGRWFYASMTPGASPLQALETALLSVAVNPLNVISGALSNQLRAGENVMISVTTSLLPDDRSCELVLVIDQFEEVFTQCDDDRERLAFLECLRTVVTHPESRLRVVITLRADFYDRPLLHPGFGDLIRQRTEVVLPLTPAELANAIQGPALRVGLELEPGLVEEIVVELGEQPGALPLLQYSLTELYERRNGMTLPLDAYRQSGGVFGALARRADELYQSLAPDEQDAVRRLFLRLVTLGEGTEDTRRRARHNEIMTGDAARDSAMSSVLDRFGKYRLLTFDRDPRTRIPTIEVAHEALIRSWKRLRDWLSASREAIRIQQRLSAAVGDWLNSKRDPSLLAFGGRLATVVSMTDEGSLVPSSVEAEFIQASIAHEKRQQEEERQRQAHELALAKQAAAAQRQSARRMRYLAAAMALFGMVAVILSAFALDQRGRSIASEQMALTAQSQARSDAATATFAQGQALISAATALAAESSARDAAAVAEANAQRSEALRLAAEASRLLETGGNPETAGLLAIRSIKKQYTPQGDEMLSMAAAFSYYEWGYDAHSAAIYGVDISPDGQYVLTASHDQTAIVWDYKSGDVFRKLVGHDGPANYAVFSRDGKVIATASDDGTIKLWDAATARQLRTIAVGGEVNHVDFSPDGRSLVSAGEDGSVRLFDAQTGQERLNREHDHPIWMARFSPDGKLLLTTSGDSAYLWDASTGDQVRILRGHVGAVYGARFSPDGKLVATASADRTVRLWDAATGAVIGALIGHRDAVNDVAFSPDGRFLLTGSSDRTARLWAMNTRQEVRQYVGHDGAIFAVAFAPDGQSFITGASDYAALRWATSEGVIQRIFVGGHEEGIFTLALSPDRKRLLTTSDEGLALVRDVQTGEVLHTFPEGTYSAAISLDGRYILTGQGDGTAVLWDATHFMQLHVLQGHSLGLNRLAFSADSRIALTTSFDKTARLWDVQTGQLLLTLAGHTATVWNGALSPDGRHALTVAENGVIRLWDARTGRLLREVAAHEGPVYAADFSPDGKLILTGGDDGLIRLWDVENIREVRTLAGAQGYVIFDAHFSPDGRMIVAACGDKTARLWDAQTGELIRQLGGSDDFLRAASFSSDGAYILTASNDRTVRVYDTDYQTTVSYLCARLYADFTEQDRVNFGIQDRTPTCSAFREESPD